MSRKTSTNRRRTAALPDPTLRHVWLAGLGGVALAQRGASARLASAKHQVERIAQRIQANLGQLRSQGEARVGQFSSEVEQRLAPVLVKFGLAQKPAAKRRTSTQARKAARRSAPRTAKRHTR